MFIAECYANLVAIPIMSVGVLSHTWPIFSSSKSLNTVLFHFERSTKKTFRAVEENSRPNKKKHLSICRQNFR